MITDTGLLRNSAYHTDLDRPETLDYRRMGASDGASTARSSRSEGGVPLDALRRRATAGRRPDYFGQRTFSVEGGPRAQRTSGFDGRFRPLTLILFDPVERSIGQRWGDSGGRP